MSNPGLPNTFFQQPLQTPSQNTGLNRKSRQWCRRRGCKHTSKFWFVENPGKILENLGKICENLWKYSQNTGNSGQTACKMDKNGAQRGENHMKTFFSSCIKLISPCCSPGIIFKEPRAVICAPIRHCPLAYWSGNAEHCTLDWGECFISECNHLRCEWYNEKVFEDWSKGTSLRSTFLEVKHKNE